MQNTKKEKSLWKRMGNVWVVAALIVVWYLTMQHSYVLDCLRNSIPIEVREMFLRGKLDLYIAQTTITFVIASVLSVLSEHTIIVYWKDITNDKLVNPPVFNFRDVFVYSMVLVVLSTISLFSKDTRGLLFAFFANLVVVGYLTYHMIEIYFVSEKQKKKCQKEFNRAYEEWKSKEAKEDGPNEMPKEMAVRGSGLMEEYLNQLYFRTREAYQNNDWKRLRENITFYKDNMDKLPVLDIIRIRQLKDEMDETEMNYLIDRSLEARFDTIMQCYLQLDENQEKDYDSQIQQAIEYASAKYKGYWKQCVKERKEKESVLMSVLLGLGSYEKGEDILYSLEDYLANGMLKDVYKSIARNKDSIKQQKLKQIACTVVEEMQNPLFGMSFDPRLSKKTESLWDLLLAEVVVCLEDKNYQLDEKKTDVLWALFCFAEILTEKMRENIGHKADSIDETMIVYICDYIATVKHMIQDYHFIMKQNWQDCAPKLNDYIAPGITRKMFEDSVERLEKELYHETISFAYELEKWGENHQNDPIPLDKSNYFKNKVGLMINQLRDYLKNHKITAEQPSEEQLEQVRDTILKGIK